MSEYRFVCAWCRKKLGKSQVKDSHGICKDCLKKFRAQHERDLARRKKG